MDSSDTPVEGATQSLLDRYNFIIVYISFQTRPPTNTLSDTSERPLIANHSFIYLRTSIRNSEKEQMLRTDSLYSIILQEKKVISICGYFWQIGYFDPSDYYSPISNQYAEAHVCVFVIVCDCESMCVLQLRLTGFDAHQ